MNCFQNIFRVSNLGLALFKEFFIHGLVLRVSIRRFTCIYKIYIKTQINTSNSYIKQQDAST